jgi:hypothetical protein
MGLISGRPVTIAAADIDQIVDEIWDELTADHVTASTMGLTMRQIRDAAISGQTADSIMSKLAGMTAAQAVASTSGSTLAQLQTELDNRLKADNMQSVALEVTLTSNVTANVKGSYVELIASTARIYTFLIIQLVQPSSIARFRVDISTGAAAAEVVLFPDLNYDQSTSAGLISTTFMVKCNIPAATRIAARCSDSTGGGTMIISCIGIG